MKPENNNIPEDNSNQNHLNRDLNSTPSNRHSESESHLPSDLPENEVVLPEDISPTMPVNDREVILEEFIGELNSDFPGIQKEISPIKLINFCCYLRESIRLKYHSIELHQSSFDNPTILRKTYIEEFEPLTFDSPLEYRAAEANLVEENYLVNYRKLLHSILTTADGDYSNQTLIDSASSVIKNLEHRFLLDVNTLKPLSIRDAALRPLSEPVKDSLIEFLTELDESPWSIHKYDDITERAESEIEEIALALKGGLDSLNAADRQINPIELTEIIFKRAQSIGLLNNKEMQIEALSSYTHELGLDLPMDETSGEGFAYRYSAILRVTNQLIAESQRLKEKRLSFGMSTDEVEGHLACRTWILVCLKQNRDWLQQFLSN